MVDTLEAAALFVLLIAPGYLFVTGFNQGSGGAMTPLNASHLAQAVPASVFVLVLAWTPLAGHLLDRLTSPEGLLVASSDSATWLLLLGLLAFAYAVGDALGWIVRWTADPPDKTRKWQLRWIRSSAQSGLGALGFYRPQTMWEEAAQWLGSASQSLVKLQLTDGSFIYGPFGNLSRMTMWPRPREIFLEKAYFENASGALEEAPAGAFIRGDQIRSIMIIDREP